MVLVGRVTPFPRKQNESRKGGSPKGKTSKGNQKGGELDLQGRHDSKKRINSSLSGLETKRKRGRNVSNPVYQLAPFEGSSDRGTLIGKKKASTERKL